MHRLSKYETNYRLFLAQYSLTSAESWPKTPFISFHSQPIIITYNSHSVQTNRTPLVETSVTKPHVKLSSNVL